MSAVKTPGVQKAIEEAKVKDNLILPDFGKNKKEIQINDQYKATLY